MVKSKWYGRLNGLGVEFGEKRFRHFVLQSVFETLWLYLIKKKFV